MHHKNYDFAVPASVERLTQPRCRDHVAWRCREWFGMAEDGHLTTRKAARGGTVAALLLRLIACGLGATRRVRCFFLATTGARFNFNRLPLRDAKRTNV